MTETGRYKKYIPWLGLLILIRFVWVPLWETKQSDWAVFNNNQMKVAKTQALIDQAEQVKEAFEKVQDELTSLETTIPLTQDQTQFTITVQTEVETLLKKHALELRFSVWRDGPVFDDLHVLFLDVSFKGELEKYVAFSMDFNQQESLKTVAVEGVALNIRSQSEQQLGTVNGKVIIKVATRIES